MQVFPINFGPWTPDLPDYNNPGLVDAKNVMPSPDGYEPVRDVTVSDDMGELIPSTAFIIAASRLGGEELVAYSTESGGTVTLKLLRNTSVPVSVDIGSVFGAESTYGLDGPADFTQFGSDVYFVGNSQVYKTSGGTMAIVSGSPSSCDVVERVGQFMMAGAGTTLYWSAFNDPDDWSVNLRNQAGSAVVNRTDLGDITGITGGRYPLLFQRRGVSRLQYVGGSKIWDVRLISDDIGAQGRGCVIKVEDRVYFFSERGIFVTDGASIQNLSDGRVSRWIADNFQGSFSNARYAPSHCSAEGRIIFPAAFSSQFLNEINGGTSTFNHLVYDYVLDRFSYFEKEKAIFFGPNENLSSRYGGGSESLTIDGTHWSVGSLGRDTASTLEATLSTGHIASAGYRTKTSTAEVHYTGSGATVAISAKDRIGASASFSAYRSEDSATGIIPARSSGKATAVSTRFAAGADWGSVSGVTIEGDLEGRR